MKTSTIKLLTILMLASILLSLGLVSCKKERGCTDTNALNKDYNAEENDGSCQYSTAVFYASAGYYSGIAISKIDVTVNNESIGSIFGIYPNGPGNCSAQGTVSFQFPNGNKVDWNTTVYLSNGAVIFGSGQASPSSVSNCIKVNVTR